MLSRSVLCQVVLWVWFVCCSYRMKRKEWDKQWNCAPLAEPRQSRTHNNNNNVQKGEKMYHNGNGWQVAGGVQYTSQTASNVAPNNRLYVCVCARIVWITGRSPGIFRKPTWTWTFPLVKLGHNKGQRKQRSCSIRFGTITQNQQDTSGWRKNKKRGNEEKNKVDDIYIWIDSSQTCCWMALEESPS
jgi:hypothetical protein